MSGKNITCYFIETTVTSDTKEATAPNKNAGFAGVERMAQMKSNNNLPGGILEQITVQHSVSITEVVREIQIAVDDAWNNTDPAIQARQRELFPNGKPSVEEFIRVIAEQAKR